MKQFLLEGKKTGIEMVFKFDSNAYLTAFEVFAEMTDTQRIWMYQNMPKTIADLRRLQTANPSTIKITEMELDLSFDLFWNTYAHKVGNKTRAKKLWEKLPNKERVKAINWHREYCRQLTITTHGKMNPETYLYQARWNN